MSDVEPTPDDTVAPEAAAVPDANAVDFRVMSVGSVLFDLANPSPQVHLMEEEPPYRHLSICIALTEAQALQNALEGIEGRRPGTHELASAIIRRLQADIIAVRIVRHENGIFYAELDLMTPRGREQFDCRTSDALILATRQSVPAPILCADEVLQSFYS
jgi:bifunctional DNase/RNase